MGREVISEETTRARGLDLEQVQAQSDEPSPRRRQRL